MGRSLDFATRGRDVGWHNAAATCGRDASRLHRPEVPAKGCAAAAPRRLGMIHTVTTMAANDGKTIEHPEADLKENLERSRFRTRPVKSSTAQNTNDTFEKKVWEDPFTILQGNLLFRDVCQHSA